MNMSMNVIVKLLATGAGLVVLTAWIGAQNQPAPTSQQQTELVARISGDAGTPPRFAVPDFIAVSSGGGRPADAETVDAAKRIAQVLFDDLTFEREFLLIPRDTYTTIPPATSTFDVPFERWQELNADGVIIGSVQKTSSGVRVEVRLFNVRTRQSVWGQEYTGAIANPRLYAHSIADDIHRQQRGLRGVARTKLTFNSDRSGERLSGTVENRQVKEVFISDYDGENQRQVTTNRSLNINSTWSPDGRSIAYASYRRGPPNIFVANIFQGTGEELTKDTSNNFLPAFSPDGTRIAFTSTRDGSGNSEIYVMNRDGSNVRRLTNHPAADTTPTWSPSGAQIAFTSDRSSGPQIYIMNADGLGAPQRISPEAYADRPTWSPSPFNEIAYAARTGPGNDIMVIDLASLVVRRLTNGEGTNESPSWSPNGRHLAFMSTRSGKSQIFTIDRTGQNLRQITRLGNNYQPDWSK
jgi:TolB protein